MQPLVPATASTALFLAAFLSLSIALVISKRVIGALGLVVGGIALLVQTAFTIEMSTQLNSALYYAAFWVPAGIAATICGARLAKPLLRLLVSKH
jgi:hypothetical protein